MKISNNWLKELVDHQRSVDTLTSDLEAIGHELDSVKPLVEASGLVIGEVVACQKHPDADKLSVCEVNIGTKTLTIVCGASNVRSDIKVIVATVGAKLPGDITINAVKLKGIVSEGMICSLLELGLDGKYLTEDDKKGIHILNDNAPVGANALEYLSFDDLIIDLDITPNRGDMLSAMGIAREVASYYNVPLKMPTINLIENDEVANININIDTPNCSLYSARVIKNVTISESPNFIKARLIASGIRPINNVVDISNYVMLETGQPLHFFDYKKVGANINVRMAKNQEKIVTLDGQTRILNDSDIVIANKERAIALAGVMGGLDTEVTDNTTDILIESAVFNPVNIHFTSSRILKSEASNRFIKGISPETTIMALDRAADLLSQYASGEILKGQTIVGEINSPDKVIHISANKINQVMGSNISEDLIIDILTRLNMTVTKQDESLLVVPPHYRLDLQIAEDIIEEVARFYGINKINSKPLIGTIKPGSLSSERDYVKRVNHYMQNLGYHQVLTYSLTSEESNQAYYLKPLTPAPLSNPMSQDKTAYRTSLIPSLIDVWSYNKARKMNHIMLYETSDITYLQNNQFQSKTLLTILASGSLLTNEHQKINIQNDFYSLKGTVESLLKYLKLSNRYQFKRDSYHHYWHPYATASLYVDDQLVGIIGTISYQQVKAPVYVAELDLSLLQAFKTDLIKYKSPRKFPSIVKDVSFLVSQQTDSYDIINLIKEAAGEDLINVKVFDVYPKGEMKSISYKLTFASDQQTLTDADINNQFHNIIDFVNKNLEGINGSNKKY